MMKIRILIAFLLIGFVGNSQIRYLHPWYHFENKVTVNDLFADSVFYAPLIDTGTYTPSRIGAITIHNTGSAYIWDGSAWQILAGAADGNNYPSSMSFSGGILTVPRNGLSDLTATIDGRYLKISDTSGIWLTETTANNIYSPVTHSHVATDISDLTSYVRNLFTGGTGITYNDSTGVISWNGSASGITSLNGLTGTTQTFTGVNIGINSTGTAHTFTNDTTNLLATKARVDHVIDSLVALMNDAYVIENMAVTNLTATGHRLHDWADYQLKVHGLGELELKSTVSGSRYSQIADAKPYFSGFNLYTQYDASNTAYISLNNANNASYLYFQTIKPGATTNIWIRPDSIDIRPHLGRINIDTLAEAANMTNKKVAVWDATTGRFEQINKDSVGTAGGGGEVIAQNGLSNVNDSTIELGGTITSQRVLDYDNENKWLKFNPASGNVADLNFQSIDTVTAGTELEGDGNTVGFSSQKVWRYPSYTSTNYRLGNNLAVRFEANDSVKINSYGGDFGVANRTNMAFTKLSGHTGRSKFIIGNKSLSDGLPIQLSNLELATNSGSGKKFIDGYVIGHQSYLYSDDGDTLTNFVGFQNKGYMPSGYVNWSADYVGGWFGANPESKVGKPWSLYMYSPRSENYLAGKVYIGQDTTIDVSSLLAVTSTTKGVVFPRMTSTQRTTIASPTTGLMVFDTDSTSYMQYTGSAWQRMGGASGGGGSVDTSNVWLNNLYRRSDSVFYVKGSTEYFAYKDSVGSGGGSGWGLTGNAGTTAGTNFLGTTDAVDLVFKTNSTERARFVNSSGNFGIGISPYSSTRLAIKAVNTSDINYSIYAENSAGNSTFSVTNAGRVAAGLASSPSLISLLSYGWSDFRNYVKVYSYGEWQEMAAPGTSTAGFARMYAKTDGLFYGVDDAGVETKLSNGTQSKAITVEFPTSTDDVLMFYTDVAITITKIADVLQGSSPSVTYDIVHSTDASSGSPNELIGTDRTLTSTTGSTTTSFSDPTVPAGSWVKLKPSATSGTVNAINVTIIYKVD